MESVIRSPGRTSIASFGTGAKSRSSLHRSHQPDELELEELLLLLLLGGPEPELVDGELEELLLLELLE